MGHCSGNCASCSGCARELVLTPPELDFLNDLAQLAFLPLVRHLGSDTPIYPGKGEEAALLLQILEKKGLISLDYDQPLSGFREDGYESYPIRGSISLTERGQKVLELLEYQGIQTE